MTRLALPQVLAIEQVIPVARRQDPVTVRSLAEALMQGGLHSIEITVEGPTGIEAIAAVSGSELVVGAGTVTSVEQASAAVEAGAAFLISPHCDPTLIGWSLGRGIPFIPGAMTPTEVLAAWSAGASAVKVFPASVGGPAFIKSLQAPFPEIPLIPTGGITAENAAAYLEAGAMAVGVGDWLTGASISEVAERARRLTDALQLV